MIQEIFLKRAANIRKEYLTITRDINSYEKNVRDLLGALEQKSTDLESLKNKLDSNRINSPEEAKIELLNIIMEVEDETNRNEKYINNLNKNIEKLKEDELLLFRDIKQRYPEMSDSDIKNEIQSYIKKLNLS
jgi:chromosome segregation ATPase